MNCNSCQQNSFIRSSYICHYCFIGICDNCDTSDWIDNTCPECKTQETQCLKCGEYHGDVSQTHGKDGYYKGCGSDCGICNRSFEERYKGSRSIDTLDCCYNKECKCQYKVLICYKCIPRITDINCECGTLIDQNDYVSEPYYIQEQLPYCSWKNYENADCNCSICDLLFQKK
jgi:hypothetical protein